MKAITSIITVVAISFLVAWSSAFAGVEGYFLVYHLEKSTVSGALTLRPVEITFDTVSDPALAVFAEWNRPYLDSNKIELEQTNKAFFKGLQVDIKNVGSGKLDAFLDYSNCGDDVKKLKSNEKNSIIEGTAAAILLTDKAQSLTLRVKGFFDGSQEVTKAFTWDKLKKKWKVNMGAFADIKK